MDLQGSEGIGGKPRKLTRFMCQELLYDYVSGSLDRARREAVEGHLPTCRDSMHELEKLRSGVDYSRALANLAVPEKLTASLGAFEPSWQIALRKITLWSEERGWKLVAPLFLVATVVAAILVWSPWEGSRINELARIEHATVVSEVETTSVPQAPLPEVAAAAAPVSPATVEPPAPPPPPLGSVYRATFEVENLEAVAEALRLKILEFQGEMRPKGDKVFDFTLPESKLEDLNTYLSSFGPVRLRKDRKPQEVPVGRNRIILVLKEVVHDDNVPAETAPTETP